MLDRLEFTPFFPLAPISTLAAAVLLTGCGNPLNKPGAERYLPYEISNPAALGSQRTDDSPIVDTISHWEGDGVRGPAKIVIDISDQRAYFYRGARLVGISKISSGMDGFTTPHGTFKITQKNEHHRSNLYGNYVYPDGRIAQRDVDVTKDPKPAGARFEGAPMPYFMRFQGGVGMHAGYLPGYAASHGCVRMPKRMAEIYFRNVNLKTPVVVQP